MICCKIVANYDDSKGDFSHLYNELSKYGAVLWSNNTLFVGSEDLKINAKKITNILKKSNYQHYFIQEYHSIADVKESEVIRGWLFDWIIRINKKRFEITQQEMLQNISIGLDRLEEDLDSLDADLQEEHTQTKEE